MYAETLADDADGLEKFKVAFGMKYEKAVECLKKDWNKLSVAGAGFGALVWGRAPSWLVVLSGAVIYHLIG